MHSQIVKARKAYFEKHPFDPNRNALLTPDEEEPGFVSMKFGYEFLAHVRTDDDVSEWLSAMLEAAGSHDLVGIMLAHAFIGIIGSIEKLIDSDPGLAERMKQIAVECWEKEF